MRKIEKDILNLIKYLPSLVIIIICSLFTYYLYYQKIDSFENETKNLRNSYIEINKDKIKYQVKRIKEQILFEKEHQVENLKNELKTQINNAYKIIETIYKKNQNKTEEEIFQIIKDILGDIRFNDNRSYIFIYKMNGLNILHPEKKFLEGKNLWNVKDSKGTYFIQEMNKILQTKDETYYSWFWKKNENKNKSYRKLGFFKKFEPLDVFIGAGEYISDFENEIKNKILDEVSNFRYDKDKYVFIIDYNGIYLSYYDKSFVGKTIYEKSYSSSIKDDFNNMLVNSKKGDFISYYHNVKPISRKKTFKYSYVDSIDDWEWIIGTGFYMDDFNKNIELKKENLNKDNNAEIQKLLIISFLLTITLLLVFLKLSSFLENKFYKYQKDIEKQINDNLKKDSILAHQSKMAAMGEMIGNIAHQWRQPLSTISTLVTGMKMKKELNISDETDEIQSLDLVNKQVQYLSHTIDDFRDFFKTEKYSNKFNMNSFIDKVLSLVAVQFNSKSIHVIKNIENIEIRSIENELIQVLINILNNAKDELIKINDEKLIFININKKDNIVFIQIKDNAGGIDEAILPKIFEPYFTTKADINGTGIGLFMTQEIVNKHLKGKIIVSNEEYNYKDKIYKGAVFTITLPVDI